MPENDSYIVELRNITKRFPKIVANDDISIQIKKGEIYALLGENGAGKSTLMSVLFGLYEPDEGEILINGKPERITSPRDATRLNIGMVHQHFRLVMNQTITENIILGMEPVKKRLGLFSPIDSKGAEEQIRQLSLTYGLEVDPSLRIEQIPVSMRQRVEILKMLYRNAEILIFDEPTAVLTPQEIESLLGIIKSLRDGGKTIILITHKLEEIKQVADRCAVLCRGKLVGVFSVADTTTQQMANMMVGRDVLFEVDKKQSSFGKEVLKVTDLSIRRQDGVEVVKHVSFSIHEGEVLAIAGVAGNGQVEIADAIAGLTRQTEGTIEFFGKSIENTSIRERTEMGISYIPEDRQAVGLLLDYELGQNLCLKTYYKEPFCHHGILDQQAFGTHAQELIDRYDIRSGEGVHAQTRSLSGGNQQKAIIAREIELDSSLLIFVQPTRGLDVGSIETINNKIIELRDQGKAVLLVSLELEEIMNCADTIGVVYNGSLQHISSASTLTANQVGEYMMGVKKTV
ncbi:ABC transporter ATP-binding protein [uncultured Sphaerochaeta sp.]|uniref:ABC transporter ATP-binding protein n=1 Tax=uncultured Sphaerochaeta sp. TaxID=886478 RepID=UPI002A0A3FF6|nr:ABC transporter ATP-binding protein [uncultured Sphaerochaeta sp.]